MVSSLDRGYKNIVGKTDVLRRTWLNHIQDADARPLSTIWRSEVARGHGGAQRSVSTSGSRGSQRVLTPLKFLKVVGAPKL